MDILNIIKLPFVLIVYTALAIASTVRWIGLVLFCGAILFGIGFVFYSISYIAESYVPALIIYSILLLAGLVRWRMEAS